MTITVDVVGTCHHEDQSCCATRAEVFCVKWCICVFLSVLSSVEDLEERVINLGQPSATQRFEIGHKGGRMAESVPMPFWSIAVNPLSEPSRRCLLSVAAYRHSSSSGPTCVKGCAFDQCKR